MAKNQDNKESFEGWKKPTWDEYFMAQAFLIAQRSIDTATKCGCVVVDKNHRPLSFGYNGPPAGCDDSKIPMTRPEKYNFMEHAEANAIDNAAAKGIALEDSIFYITGPPCVKCLRSILQIGASEVIYGPVGAACIDEQDKKAKEILLSGRKNILMREFKGRSYRKVLERTLEYDLIKNGKVD